MGAELATKLNQIYGWAAENTLFFSDSTTTLWWLRTTKPLKIFVANRVCNILDVSTIEQWRYVNTKENPADLPTRTASVQQLAKHHLWWWGPEFLTVPEAQWGRQPALSENSETLAETRDLNQTLNKLHMAKTHITHELGQKWIRTIWSYFASPKKGLVVAGIVFQAAGKFLRAAKTRCMAYSGQTTHLPTRGPAPASFKLLHPRRAATLFG